MKKILIFSGPEGHASIAASCKQALTGADFKTKTAMPDLPDVFNLHVLSYRYFPTIFKLPYKLGEEEQIAKLFKSSMVKKLAPKIKKEVKKEKPNLIISTYTLLNPSIEKMLDYQVKKIPFINVIANPWTIHPLEYSDSADLNIVYDKKGVKQGIDNGILKDKLAPIGWMVRKEFYEEYDKNRIRKSLGFDKNKFTLLVCGGSEGTNMILKIIPAIMSVKKPLQVIVVCGTNKGLYNNLVSLKKLLPERKNNLNLKLFKYRDDMAQLISVSDLVIGKAGPNLIFETIASKKPFCAICRIYHEDANLEIIKKKNLGLVEINTFKVIKKLKNIINNPGLLDKYRPDIEKEREKNLKAHDRLVEKVKEMTNGQ